MSLLNALINVQITAETKVPTAQGFGTPMLFTYHTKWPGLLKAYTDPADLISDGFTVNDPTYKMASKIFSQTPHPPIFYVGRRQTPFQQKTELTLCNTGSLSYLYSFTIVDDLGESFPVSKASTGVAATDATAIFTLLTAETATYDHTTTHAWTPGAAYAPYIKNGAIVQIGGTPPTGYSALTNYFMVNCTDTTFQLSATKGGSVVVATTDNGTSCTLLTVIDNCTLTNPSAGMLRLTSVAGHMVDVTGLPVPAASGANGTITVATTTTDPGIVADLVAVEAIDPISWYGIFLDSNSKAEVLALAAHVESEMKVFGFTTTDSDCGDNAVTTDVLSQLKAAGYTRTLPLYLANETESYAACAWMGGMLATQPGAGNWAWRDLPGVTVDGNLGGIVNTITSIAGASSKNGNVYVGVAGLGTTLSGFTPSGEFIDVPIFIDWLTVGIQVRMQTRLANASAAGRKIPYTDAGTQQFAQDVQAQLAAGSADPNPGLTPGTTSVTAPKVATMSPTNKGKRQYGPIAFTGQLSGSINGLTVNGTVTL
jgi:hypothetical protein